jgi:hypothetical protein
VIEYLSYFEISNTHATYISCPLRGFKAQLSTNV